MRTRDALSISAIWMAAALSGGAALSYEICWSRALVVPLGNSTDAAALVLAGFMLGIGAGARVGGGLAERVAVPLRFYALMELILGLVAILAPLLLRSLSGIPSGLDGVSVLPLGIAARYVAAVLTISLPCLAMGASLPLLVRALTRPGTRLGPQIGIAYGANTVGAAVGACATGFWGIASMGVWRCSACAAVGSVAAAGLALLASLVPGVEVTSQIGARGTGIAHERCVPDMASGTRDAGSDHPTSDSVIDRLALTVVFVSGIAMLACEVLWSRVLTFVFGHDTYAFASLLAIVLFGLGSGGLVHRLLVRFDPTRVLAVLCALLAASVPVCFWIGASVIVRRGTDPMGLQVSGNLATSAWQELGRALSYTPILVFVPSVLAGALFPAACSLYGRTANDAGRKVGVVGLVNGVGSAIGALVSALGLVSLAGVQGAFVVVAILLAGGSCAAVLVACRSARCARAAAQGSNGGHTGSGADRPDTPSSLWPRLSTAALTAAPLGVVAVLVATMPRDLPRRMLLKVVGEHHQTLLSYDEARTGTVSVIANQINGEKQLLMNAVNEVTTRLVHDQSFKLLGHLAPLLHPKPERGLMICLGAGLSAGATATHPLHRLDVVDLSSAMQRAAGYFAEENNHVLDNPVVHVHVGDGRQFLLNSSGQYDVVVVDSTHPKAVDSWILYTAEFYELVRNRLAEGGIAVQWLPLHGLSEREFKIVVRTFQGVFPEMTLWANVGFETYGQVAYAKMVGTQSGRLVIDVAELSRRLERPEVHEDLSAFGMSSTEEILDSFLAGSDAIRAWTDGLPVQTDDHPIVPYVTQYSSGRRMEPVLLLAVRSPVTPLLSPIGSNEAEVLKRLEEAFEAQGLVMAGLLGRAAELRPRGEKIRRFEAQARTSRDYYASLAERYPRDPDRLFEAATQLGGLGFPEEARPIYQHGIDLRPDDLRLRLNYALLLLELRETGQSIELLSRLRLEKPRSAAVLYNLGAALLASGDAGAAKAHLEQALMLDPDLLGARMALSEAHLDLGELDRAGAQLEKVVKGNPWVSEAHEMLGLVASQRGDRDLAIRHHARAVNLQPYRAASHYNLGLALQASNAIEQAEVSYLNAIRIDPKHAAALNNLGLVYAARGEPDRAADLYLQALDADAGYALAAHNLGVALRAQARERDAVQAFCLALRLNPELGPSRRQLAELGTNEQECAR